MSKEEPVSRCESEEREGNCVDDPSDNQECHLKSFLRGATKGCSCVYKNDDLLCGLSSLNFLEAADGHAFSAFFLKRNVVFLSKRWR